MVYRPSVAEGRAVLMAWQLAKANGIAERKGWARFESLQAYYSIAGRDLGRELVPLLNELTHLPVVVDPSHATGKRSLVPPLARAAVAIGADGVILEVHPCPEKAVSDGAQSLDIPQFKKMMKDLEPYIDLWNKSRMSEAVVAV